MSPSSNAPARSVREEICPISQPPWGQDRPDQHSRFQIPNGRLQIPKSRGSPSDLESAICINRNSLAEGPQRERLRPYWPPAPFSSRLKYSSSPARNSSGKAGPDSPADCEMPWSSRTSFSLTPPPIRASAESMVVPVPPPPGFEPPPPPPLGLIRLERSSSSMASVSAPMAGLPVSGRSRISRRLAHDLGDLAQQRDLLGRTAPRRRAARGSAA